VPLPLPPLHLQPRPQMLPWLFMIMVLVGHPLLKRGMGQRSIYEFYCRVVREKTRWEFSSIPYVEIENDHLHSEFVHYCQWLIHHPIPRNWKEVNGEMVPPPNQGDGPVHIIMYSTLSKYLGRTIAGLQRKFPRHPDFVNLKKNEVPSWWSILRPKFEKDCERTQMKINSDFTYGGPKFRPCI